MFHSKQIIILFFIIFHFSCKNQSHTIVFEEDKLKSENIIPPSGCYKIKLIANGELICNSKLVIIMDSKETNFLDYLDFNGTYVEKEIYYADWYENTFQLELRPDSCLVNPFRVKVIFYD